MWKEYKSLVYLVYRAESIAKPRHKRWTTIAVHRLILACLPFPPLPSRERLGSLGWTGIAPLCVVAHRPELT